MKYLIILVLLQILHIMIKRSQRYHYYLMYIKFGFGRATQDAGIEIRRGAMTRDQAINLVKLYDGVFRGTFNSIFRLL